MNKSFITKLSLFFIVIIFISGCSAKAQDQTNGNDQITDENLQLVELVTVTKSSAAYEENYSGIVKPINEVQVIAESSGSVTDVYFNVGDNVKENDTVAELDKNENNPTLLGYSNAINSLNNSINNFNLLNDVQDISTDQAGLALEQSRKTLEDTIDTFDETKELSEINLENSRLAIESLEEQISFLEETKENTIELQSKGLDDLNDAIDTAYDEYKNALKDYNNAKAQNLPETEVQNFLSILDAKDLQYETALNTLENTETTNELALIQLDSQIASLESQLKTSKNAFESSEIASNLELQALNDQIDSLEIAYESSKKTFDLTVTNGSLQLNQAQSQIDTSNYQKDLSALSLENLKLNAPISGIISENFLEIGEYISQFSPVFKITDLSKLKAAILVPKETLKDLKLGQKVTIDGQYEATIFKVYPTADQVTNKITVELVFDFIPELIPGVLISVNVPLKSSKESLFIPLTALNVDQQESTVFIYHDFIVNEINVAAGEIVGDMIEITTGLDEGDKIVNNPFLIKDGDKVRTR